MPRRRSRLHSVTDCENENQGWRRSARGGEEGERGTPRTRFDDLHIRTVIRINLSLFYSARVVCAFKREFDIYPELRARSINPDFSHFLCFSGEICELPCSLERKRARDSIGIIYILSSDTTYL